MHADRIIIEQFAFANRVSTERSTAEIVETMRSWQRWAGDGGVTECGSTDLIRCLNTAANRLEAQATRIAEVEALVEVLEFAANSYCIDEEEAPYRLEAIRQKANAVLKPFQEGS